MDAHKTLISGIFNMTTLVEIPFFQRSYVWKEDLWERFLSDMEFIVKTRSPHFFGALILKDNGQPPAGSPYASKLTLVDGQQRLTTFLIFLKVLCLKSQQLTAFDAQYRLIATQEIALRHGKNDVDAFEKVMSMTSANPINGPEASSQIVKAYNYFLQNADISKLDYMVILANTQFVRIDLDRNDNEQQIFDSINSLGVNLTLSELLKNYFFSRDSIVAYQRIWESVFEKDADAKAYWETEIDTGRFKRAMIDIFFDSYFQLFIQDKQYNVSNDDKLAYTRIDNLFDSYQKFINKYCGGNKNVLLSSLKDYALCFQDIFRPAYCRSAIPSDFGIERLNIVIFGLKNTTMIPYVLFLAKNVANPLELNKMYGILESYIMRRIVVRTSTKNYNNLFSSLILNRVLSANQLSSYLKKLNNSTSYLPNDSELLDGFQKSKLMNLHSRGILYLLESHYRPANSAVALLGFDNYSLEHLMPKKWRNHWPACASNADADARDSKLLTLGNLAIIPLSLNTAIRDSDWPTKKAGKGNKAGLDLCAAGLITVYDALQCPTWDESTIDNRALFLYRYAAALWNF